jgi:hypothetical protein
MRFVICLTVVAAIVSGCQATQSFKLLDAEQKKALIRTYQDDCKAFGFRRGTHALARCVQKSIKERDRAIALARDGAVAGARPTCDPGYPRSGIRGSCF